MAFLKTILILLLGYYLLKILARWFAPRLFSYAAKKAEKHFREQFGTFRGQGYEEQQQPGDGSTTRKSTHRNNSSEHIGEYIDFEEIE
ncbi:MAG TPA: DUF4834 family protein [Eudoraea sp.]|nr:DUF4834 family protein [Eudoraea sp.]